MEISSAPSGSEKWTFNTADGIVSGFWLAPPSKAIRSAANIHANLCVPKADDFCPLGIRLSLALSKPAGGAAPHIQSARTFGSRLRMKFGGWGQCQAARHEPSTTPFLSWVSQQRPRPPSPTLALFSTFIGAGCCSWWLHVHCGSALTGGVLRNIDMFLGIAAAEPQDGN